MQYIQLDLDKYIQYDSIDSTVAIISKSSLQSQIGDLQASLPVIPDNKTLLAWAKANYPGLAGVDAIKAQIAGLQAILNKLTNNAVDASAVVAKAINIQ